MSEAVRAVHLRASLVWRDEVMADTVLTTPSALTIGSTPKATFLIPQLGLPADFAIIKPGNRGYLLTLGDRMRGVISVDGGQKDVQEFVQRGGEGGDAGALASFRATAIGGRDWGVVELDDSGDYKLFFQFVPVEAPLPKPPMGRYREILAIGAVITAAAIAFPSYATVIVLAAMGGTALFEIVLGFMRADEDDFTRPAIAFSILLFALLLGVAHKFHRKGHPWVYPGARDITAGFLVERLNEEPPTPPPPPEPLTASIEAPDEAAAEDGDVEEIKSASKGEAGKSGGQGDKQATSPDVEEGPPPPPDKGVFKGKNKALIASVSNLDLLPDLSKYGGVKGPAQDGTAGQGTGTGYGIGDDANGTGTRGDSKGTGRGGAGSSEGRFKSTGKPTVGETRKPKGTGGDGAGVKEAKVKFEGSSGDFSGGLTREEVDRVVKSRKGTIQACYQREANRDRSLEGKLVVNFSIDASGKVTSTRIAGDRSTLKSSGVESCVKRQIQGLKFPAKGGAIVNYPFIFSQG